ncbi:hypothetical protein BCR33DRAFT_158105 [Rhizoclosmatium globosum]|uniref:Uncharacterized protein n=1 Tax=Rhizoclosmatium globosum TaxID=329046 RepID=A0A1Y2CGR7_9FUNG|nr:hypothetical protein BCR33DRAFT_158105 [Rhizoclosmatium globosum]|eukprot:ORY46014.1 hypothetical protein BCR33DRAFT_158105 [Rhizoclosmatium globosum]
MLRREDLHPQLHNLDLCYHDTENELQECANGINSVINSFIQHEMMCQHSTQVNKSVAAELQQAGVFGVATKKLLVSDILQEVYSRIRVSVLGNMDGVSPSNVNSWQNLVNTFSQTRKRQEEVYSSTHKLFSGAATAEPVTATVSTVSSQVSLSQTSFNIDSPARLLNHGNPPDLLLGDKIDANSDSEGRKRKRHTQESESPVFASKLKAVLKPILALSEELDPNYSIFSSLSRIQTTPLKDLIQENYRRYPNDLKQGTPDEGGKFQNSIGKHSESVLVEETEEPDKRRRISGESSRTSQSSRTTAGEFKEGLIGGSQPISTEDEFHEYGSSAFSVVEYEGVIVDELALSAESDEATGSLIAQATLKRQ